MFAQAPPVYCVDALTLNVYVEIMNCRVGHDVPLTTDVTATGVAVASRGSSDARAAAEAVTAVPDGADTSTRSDDPQATTDTAASATAPNDPSVRNFVTTFLLKRRRPLAAGPRIDRVHASCRTSSIHYSSVKLLGRNYLA